MTERRKPQARPPEATPAPNARRTAVQVLHRVLEKGAWAAPTLDAELRRAPLGRRDAALATEIVYGTLRALPRLDRSLEPFLRDPRGLDGWARAALRAGVYQLVYLTRVPPFAVVDDAVTLVRRERGAKLGGLVNAVLRRVAASVPSKRVAEHGRLEVPAWLEDELRRSLGEERSAAFFDARTLPPPIGIRAIADREVVREELERELEGAEIRDGKLVPTALLLRGGGDPRRLEGYLSGRFTLQEQGAQAVAHAVLPEPGQRALDACAGRGGKTAILAEAVGPEGQVIATDIHERKLDQIGEELSRLRSPAKVETRAVDLTVGAGGLLAASFDFVLVDAPCTGLGTLHRRPEILLRLTPEDPARMAEVQRTILLQSRRLVRPGGVLSYAVCSPADSEGANVASAIDDERIPLAGADSDGARRFGPWEDDADAYQVFAWRIA